VAYKELFKGQKCVICYQGMLFNTHISFVTSELIVYKKEKNLA